jgi:hypothetical protein
VFCCIDSLIQTPSWDGLLPEYIPPPASIPVDLLGVHPHQCTGVTVTISSMACILWVHAPNLVICAKNLSIGLVPSNLGRSHNLIDPTHLFGDSCASPS